MSSNNWRTMKITEPNSKAPHQGLFSQYLISLQCSLLFIISLITNISLLFRLTTYHDQSYPLLGLKILKHKCHKEQNMINRQTHASMTDKQASIAFALRPGQTHPTFHPTFLKTNVGRNSGRVWPLMLHHSTFAK